MTLSRLWAAQGLRSLRCDLSGLGDSPARPGQPVDQWFPPEALEDVLEIAAAVSPADPSDVVLIGLCSGGYHAIEGALVLGAAGVCGINPVLPHKPGELRSETAALTEKTDARRQAAAARKWWVRALPAHDQSGTAPRQDARCGVVGRQSGRRGAIPGACRGQTGRGGRADAHGHGGVRESIDVARRATGPPPTAAVRPAAPRRGATRRPRTAPARCARACGEDRHGRCPRRVRAGRGRRPPRDLPPNCGASSPPPRRAPGTPPPWRQARSARVRPLGLQRPCGGPGPGHRAPG